MALVILGVKIYTVYILVKIFLHVICRSKAQKLGQLDIRIVFCPGTRASLAADITAGALRAGTPLVILAGFRAVS